VSQRKLLHGGFGEGEETGAGRNVAESMTMELRIGCGGVGPRQESAKKRGGRRGGGKTG